VAGGGGDMDNTNTTMESDYYVNFKKQSRCRECPLAQIIDWDDKEDYENY
jgi:hypothetical protein